MTHSSIAKLENAIGSNGIQIIELFTRISVHEYYCLKSIITLQQT